MQINKLKLTNITKPLLLVLIKKIIKFDYETHSEELSVLVKEEYVALRGGHETKILSICETDSEIILEIVTNDGGSLMEAILKNKLPGFPFFIKKILKKHRKEYGFEFEEIKS